MEVEFESFRGKSGSVSFMGLTYQSAEESKLVSAPFKENSGSFIWILAPVALFHTLHSQNSSLLQLLRNCSRMRLYQKLFPQVSEVFFYIGLAIFVWITDHVQKPYLEFSAKRWSLITGLRVYIISSFFTTGAKVYLPIYLVCCFWSVLVPILFEVYKNISVD